MFLETCLGLYSMLGLANSFWKSTPSSGASVGERTLAKLGLQCSLGVTQFVDVAADRSPSRVDVVATDCTASDKYAGH